MDLSNDLISIALIENFYKHNKPWLLSVMPRPLCLKLKPRWRTISKGKEVTGFSNSEEEAVKLTKVVPFLLEDELKKQGALYSNGADWSPYVNKMDY